MEIDKNVDIYAEVDVAELEKAVLVEPEHPESVSTVSIKQDCYGTW